ncbi:FAD:protein FMN transferase [Stutzerimonas tarimensis]|uniref:FAD:protein FMN transferase n=1 Tax=Stutzerimonas tarimensis TaxID=1507735 RepID=A0ABV7T1Y9_9GAMM
MGQPFLRPVIVVALATALAGCLVQDSVETYVGPTMGSTYSVKYVRTEQGPAPEQMQRETEAFLAELDAQVSTYRPDSDIQRFNAAPAGTCMPMADSVLAMVSEAAALSDLSQGALDLTIAPLLDAWGFGPNVREERVPTEQDLASARERVGYQHLSIVDGELCKSAPVVLDFNSIAAGYAVDRVSAHLEELGVRSYLVEITGELKAVGVKPDGSPWRIAIEAPVEGERTAQQIIELDDYSISTSGDYRNYFERDGKRFSHTIDPASGVPIQHALASVTVADPSALRADALSTVLLVLGPERGMAFAEREGIAAFFVTREEQAFITTSTDAFERLFGAGADQ